MPDAGGPLAVGRTTFKPGRRRFKGASVARLTVLVVLALIFLAPMVWLFLVAIKTLGELAAVPIRILPENPQWGNFHDAFTVFPWLMYAWHSLFLSSLFGGLTVCSS